MCRLYGFRATHPTQIECSLVEAQNALLRQSEQDSRGLANSDGWGIARWGSEGLLLDRHARSAANDLRFTEVAAQDHSTAAIAHVRAATIGDPTPDNTHPFRHGPWVFAHNGTVTAFERVAPLLNNGPITPTGTTDSEHVFSWLLNRMPDFGLDPERPASSPGPIARLIASAVVDLHGLSNAMGARRPPKLNFLISDGSNLVASRWGNTLYWTYRDAVPDCAVCGLSHCRKVDDGYRAIVIASEPITDERWTEVQEGSVVSVDDRVTLVTRDLLVPAA
ncbi:MAG: class II glutamine amidotransferase [Acidimicrobiia bacterium]